MYGLACLSEGKISLCETEDNHIKVFANIIDAKKTSVKLNDSASKYGWKYRYFPVPLPNVKEYIK